MPYTYIDEQFVAQAQCPSNKQKIEYQDFDSYLLLEVRPSGRKTFAFRYRDDEGVQHQHKIGSYPNISTELAHREVDRLEDMVATGGFVFIETERLQRGLTRTQRDVLERAQLEIADALGLTAASVNIGACF